MGSDYCKLIKGGALDCLIKMGGEDDPRRGSSTEEKVSTAFHQ